MKKLVIAGVAIPAIFIMLFFAVFGILIAGISPQEEDGMELTPITFTGERKGDSLDLTAKYGGTVIPDIKGTVAGEKFTAKNKGGGKTIDAHYTGYYPANNAMEGGFGYAASGAIYEQVTGEKPTGNLVKDFLDKNIPMCAVPTSIPYGTKLTVEGTGTDHDGKAHLAMDCGGAIKVCDGKCGKKPSHKAGTYHIDLLCRNAADANAVGRRNGKATLGVPQVDISGTIKDETIIITGTIGGVAVMANGTVKDGKIEATGYYGNGANLNGGNVGQWKGGKLGWPLPGYPNISGAYGTNRGDHIHAGIDIGTQGATTIPCVAAEGGVVVKRVSSIQGGPRGHYIDIDHGGGCVTRYQHLKDGTGLSVGSVVKKGDKIGIVGGSGWGRANAYAMHLHFEVFINGSVTNPVPYLKR